ncbi:MAG: class I SAM-dependent RNA methyltransferase, partial [Pyrinomonadaceae bacterium]
MKPFRPTDSGKFLTLNIERIVPDGYGIGFADGLTVFVPLTAAGDTIKVRVDWQKGKIAFASLIEILKPSADRVVPLCPFFGRCGGCDFQQMNYEAQLRAKAGIIKDALRRIGKIDWQDKIQVVPSPVEWNYRTRVQWKREGDRLGYFERNSHRVIDVDLCPILAPALQNELNNQRENFKKTNFAEVQAVSNETEVSRRFGRQNAHFDENFYAANKKAGEEEREISINKAKTKEIYQMVGKFTYAFSAATFFQVNHALLLQFVETAIGDANGNLALDLYCGVGLFALPLAKRFTKVLGIEGNQQSIEFARSNARQARLPNAKFEVAFVGEWLTKNTDNLKSPDLVLLDPPRTGAERITIASLLRLKPNQIVYVSCNPATLARDLQLLLESNVYKIEQITAFDFFPQTHHVETIV